MKIAQYIVEYLKQRGINTVFGYIGGYNADILDCFCADPNNRFVLNYHEQASSFAVNTYAELTHSVGVATASGAPSFCNMIAGIANAYFDSHPCVFILGSAHSLAIRQDKTIRQNAFEEIDAVSLVKDITKYAVKVLAPSDIRYELEKCFHIAEAGRQGPVLIDIPYDIIRVDIDVVHLRRYVATPDPLYDEIDCNDILARLQQARRPVLLLGGGARGERSRKLLQQFLAEVEVPVVATLCGLDVLPHDHKCFFGFVGHYGNRYANLLLKNCDFLIVMGARLDERQLGGYKTTFAKDAFIVRVDLDKAELGRKIPESLSCYSSAERFLDSLLKCRLPKIDFSKWLACAAVWKSRYPSLDVDLTKVSALNFLSRLSDSLAEDAIVCADVGQNQMMTAQALKLYKNRRLFNSAGYGSMGFSLPAAIGCAYARPKTCVLSINGDGGIQMNIQELQTLVRDKLAVNVIILNNHCLGMIRKTQEKLFNGKDFVSVKGYTAPDFESISKAYGVPYMKIASVDQYADAGNFISDTHATVIEVDLPTIMENVPEPGSSIEMQHPELAPEEFAQIRKECMLDA